MLHQSCSLVVNVANKSFWAKPMEEEYSKICRLSFKEEAVTVELYTPAVMHSAYSFSAPINYWLAVTHCNLQSNSPFDFAESFTIE